MKKRRTALSAKRYTLYAILVTLLCLILPQAAQAATKFDGWRVLPIRSQQEFEQGKIGGEAEQHHHSIARSLYNPKVIYLSHDIGQVWRSTNAGDSWKKTLGKNLYVIAGQSIEVDPVNPNIVFVIVDATYNWLINPVYNGLYKSEDGGDNWKQVLSVKAGVTNMHQHSIAYDPTSITQKGAMTWYAATSDNGLFRSEDQGNTWTESLGFKKEPYYNVSTQGSYDSEWPPKLMFNGNYKDTSVLTLKDFKINYNFNETKILDRIEIYQGDWKGKYDYAENLSIVFDDGTSMIATLQNLPFQKQTIQLNGKSVNWMKITVTSIYESPDPAVTWGGFAEIDVIDNNGKDVTIWDDGMTTIYDIKCHPTDGKTVYGASNKGLYCSNNKGKDMTKCGNLPEGEVSSIEINPQNPNEIYATIKGQGLYKSTTGINGFSLLKSFDAHRIFMNPGYPNTIYLAGLSANTIISHDGGKNWITNMITVPAPGLGRSGSGWKGRIAGSASGIAPNPKDPNEAVAYSRATIWKTTNGGNTFVDSSTLFTGFAWSWWNDAVAFDPFTPKRFAFFNCDVGMTITNNGGDYFERCNDQAWTWKSQGKIGWIGTYAGDFQPIENSQIMVASVGDYFKTQLMSTVDEGKTWSLVTEGSTNVEQNLFIAFHPADPNLVFAGNKVSHDAGKTFTKIDFGDFNSYNPSVLGMCRAKPDVLYALDSGRTRILRSDDRGTHWYLYVQPGWKFTRLDKLPTFAADPGNCDKVWTLDKNYDLAVYDGKSWRSTGVLALAGGSQIANFIRTVAIDPNHPEIIYAGMFAAGISCIWRSIDGGYTWQDISYNLPRLGMSAMAVNPHTGELFKGSGFGTWVFPPPYESKNLIYDKCISMSSIVYGDVSGEGEVSAYDAALTAQAAVELITLTPDQVKAADVSGDGEVSAYDAALIAQKAVGLIDRFPVES